MDYRSFKVTINGEQVIYRFTLAAAGATSNVLYTGIVKALQVCV